jgi:hypothetical protein
MAELLAILVLPFLKDALSDIGPEFLEGVTAHPACKS